ncbi:putative poly(A)-specific ribonuclease [Medicago truncatula]|uniref:Carbon catabolite repressor-like protein n=1 Tax=Medicago truncatula TaxID=3880 RepID=G7L904_MEDTR|nr:carbon catabolite repressor protein 4 homolog 3 isoform X1 [Medicago truncatula]AET05304.1 carbon catabolite repressor-like protein [Medicago truncatula]RHN43704.1 putative poly(A)-specific ribonuclease [Medicago truncatula]
MASSTWLISSFFKFSFPTRASQIHCQCNTNSNSSSRGIQRRWVEAFDQSLASPERFTVASYNILADRNASQHTDLYVNVPSRYINWNRRQKILSEELFEWNPDIICLQEVDMYVELSNILVKAGYAGSYKRRTGDTSDGCAMFWKADKFRLLDGESIQYKNIGLRDNVAQLLVFEMSGSDSRRLLVGNIHVLYNPNRGEVKLGQIRFLSSKAQSLSEKWGNAPVILAGDFNSTPESGIYKFLSTSELNIKLYDRKQLSGQKRCRPAQVLGEKKETVGPFSSLDGLLDFWTDEEVKTATGDSECHLAVHPLKLNSSYATVNGSASTRGLNGEPLATSYHSKFLGTVDYLWYSEGIVPTRVLDTVSISDLLREGGLPCKKVGSDHLALLSEFSFSVAHNKSTDITAAAASPRVDIE